MKIKLWTKNLIYFVHARLESFLNTDSPSSFGKGVLLRVPKSLAKVVLLDGRVQPVDRVRQARELGAQLAMVVAVVVVVAVFVAVVVGRASLCVFSGFSAIQPARVEGSGRGERHPQGEQRTKSAGEARMDRHQNVALTTYH